MVEYGLYGKLPLKDIKTTFDTICNLINSQLKLSEDLWFDVNIVSKTKIRFINNKYRKINKITDVISFANRDNKNIHISLLGEIYICLDQAKKQAKEYKHSLNREICFLFIHGLLHLLGYDHQNKKQEKEMFGLTDKIINKIINKLNIK